MTKKKKPQPERRYRLEITQEQAYVLRDALEAYARIKHGQIDTVIRDLFRDRYCTGQFNYKNTKRLCDWLKEIIFPELTESSYHGVGSKVYPDSTVAWAVMQVLRHRLAWDRLADEGKSEPEHYGVQYNEPFGHGVELPKMEQITNETPQDEQR